VENGEAWEELGFTHAWFYDLVKSEKRSIFVLDAPEDY